MSLHTSMKTYRLSNGESIPAIALGTYLANEGECAKSVQTALQKGYRHIDTAAYYDNEQEVGQGIRDSGVPREEIFVTTKIWNDEHKDVPGAFQRLLNKLGLQYLDLYLIHWPISIDPQTQNRILTGIMSTRTRRCKSWSSQGRGND
ncbi:Aldo/keto reductase [Metschnikowia bicuspidata var. bicuspidata NRRL YB-4993]|uniref:Aldo/keto reductase n=1 Tax=Metschnikowia bicuspidata var. bicuspidata NRRL YB-4993 TaxID=869754 RepID=A0A1A0HFG1_9ASCO|nr:Aldo/keto reductase [Metschnikowia bicuspidata var. bicuspidata NRRL YB-4993]OBA22603.1 Aldo/keto reductase [Metschnikowia bicuspidata var. bicuspidata NRRL YB-4993]